MYLLSCTSFSKAATRGRDAFERGKAKVVDKKEPRVCVFLQRRRITVHVLHYREKWDMSVYIMYRSAGPEGGGGGGGGKP